MLLLTAEQATRVQALAKEILDTLEKSHHISLDAPAPTKTKAAPTADPVVRKVTRRSAKKAKRAKRLTAEQVQQIREALSSGITKAAVSRKYAVSYSTVFKISRGELYKKVKV
jgi:DNA-binding transcriptional regulator YiaG